MSRHASLLSSQMQLFLTAGLHPLVMPGDPYLSSWAHRLGSSLFFGCTLGTLSAVIAMAFSVIPWYTSRFSPRDGITYLVMGALNTYLGYSAEMPILSFLFGFLSPAVFFLPWAAIIRKSTPRDISIKRWLVIACLVSSPFVSFMVLGSASFEMIRDSMVVTPVMRTVSDFYYNHTLLAAHVIKPVADQEQKVIAVSDEIKHIGPIPHGSLWIITPDPCGIEGKSLTVSRSDLACESIILPDERPANAANRVIQEYSTLFDKNEKMRQGIGLFFYKGPILLVPLLFMLWFSLFLSNLMDRTFVFPLLILAGYLALFTPTWKNMYGNYQLTRDKDAIARFILSEHEEQRYLALASFPEEFSDSELIRYSQDKSPRIRLRSLFEAGKRKSVKFLGLYEGALKDPQLNVRTRACWALGKIDSEQAIELLTEVFLNDPSWYVRGYAYRALGKTRPVARIIKVDA